MEIRSALSWIHVTGLDAREFLQSQCTGDLRSLKPGEGLFTGVCQAQGRLIATLIIACVQQEAGNETFALILPKTMAEGVQSRLQKYIMRRKVLLTQDQGKVIHDEMGQTMAGLSFIEAGQSWGLISASSLISNPDNPLLTIAQDIERGRVWITPATNEQFVPQMIGLDKQGGVSFNKGCYPGQEVVARMHYLGKSKRGLFRAKVQCAQEISSESFLLGASVVDDAGKDWGQCCAIKLMPPPLMQALLVLSQESSPSSAYLLVDGKIVASVSSIQSIG